MRDVPSLRRASSLREHHGNDQFASTPFTSGALVVGVVVVAAVATVAIAALLVNIFERQQEARNPFYRVVELTDETTDPAIWGKNFPLQYDGYVRTVDQVRTRYGGSEAVPRTPTPPIRARSSRSRGSRRIRG